MQLTFALRFLFFFRVTLAFIGISLLVIGTTLVGQLPDGRWEMFPSTQQKIGLSLSLAVSTRRIFDSNLWPPHTC